MHVLDLIQQWTNKCPNRIAHKCGNKEISYKDLNISSDLIAVWFDQTLKNNYNPVIVHGHKETEMLIAFLGAVKSGRAYIPIDISTPSHRVEKIIATSQASIIITPFMVSTFLNSLSDKDAVKLLSQTHKLQRVQAKDAFYILYTSGSTGEPKGVMITHDNLIDFIKWMNNEQKYNDTGEVFLNQAPFSFDLSVMDLYGSLTTGGTLISITKEEIASFKKLFNLLFNSNITTWVSTPSFIQMCLVEENFHKNTLPYIRRFLFCGEVLPRETVAELLKRFPDSDIWNTYGPTETTVATTSVRIDTNTFLKYKEIPVGRPKPGTAILICNENGETVTDGEQGEIVIIGPNVSEGYYNQKELTERFFKLRKEGWSYYTGDLGYIHDTQLFFNRRKDNQIKLNGHRIELGDIENNIRKINDVVDTVVLPVYKKNKIDFLVAFVVLKNKNKINEFDATINLKEKLLKYIPLYMIPQKFIFKNTFKLTLNGKIDRHTLIQETSLL